MKTRIFLLGFLISFTFSFGQQKWGEWEAHPCFSGIKARAKKNWDKSYNGSYEWSVQIQNNYSQSVQLTAYFGDGISSKQGNLFTISAGSQGSTLVIDSHSSSLPWSIDKVCFYKRDGQFWCHEKEINGYASYALDCSGKYNIYDKKLNSNNQNSNTSQNNNQSTQTQQTGNSFMDVYRQAMSANESGRYDEAITLWNKAYTVAVNDEQRNQAKQWAEQSYQAKQKGNQQIEQQKQQQENQRIAQENARRAEEERQKKVQAKQELINITVNGATDLINYFATRKNALRNSLSSEDAQALIAIVNSENPTEYTQNIIQIFTDLGYTHRKTDKKDETTYIFLNNDIQNINDFMMISIHLANKYNDYNSISFSYHRRKKLLEQLSSLGSNLKGFDMPEITGISPSRQKNREEKNRETENKKLELEKYVPKKLNKVLESNITAKYVIEEHIKTIGGLEKLKSINNSTTTFKNEKGTLKSIVAHRKISNKGTSDGNSYKSVFNGTTGYSEWNGNKIKIDKKMIPQFQKNQPIFILKFYQNPDLELKGVELFRDKECYAVSEKNTLNEVLSVHTYYFDIKSFELLGIEFVSNAINYQSKSYLLYDDYREVDGISFAFTQTTISENYTSISKITEIKLNEPLTDKDFE